MARRGDTKFRKAERQDIEASFDRLREESRSHFKKDPTRLHRLVQMVDTLHQGLAGGSLRAEEVTGALQAAKEVVRHFLRDNTTAMGRLLHALEALEAHALRFLSAR